MKLPTKILIVNWQDMKNPLAGGAEVHLHQVARQMVQKGMECFLYVSKYPGGTSRDVIEGVQVYRQGSRWNFNFIVYLNIKKWARKHNPDMLIDDSNKIPFFLSWFTKKPVLTRIHHLFRTSIFQEASLPSGLYVYIMESIGIAAWRRGPVVTVSESTKAELASLGVLNVRLAINGVDSREYYFNPEDEKKKYALLYLGRIKKYKGIDTLIDAVKILKNKFPEVSLVVAGQGDDLPRLKEKVKKDGLQDVVKFKGFVKDDEKRQLYAESTLMLNSSLKEGYGLTTIEANACGTCVIATDVPGLRDSIQDGHTGFLVPYGNGEALCQKIERFLSDAELRERMQKAALKWAGSHTWERTYSQTMDAITQM